MFLRPRRVKANMNEKTEKILENALFETVHNAEIEHTLIVSETAQEAKDAIRFLAEGGTDILRNDGTAMPYLDASITNQNVEITRWFLPGMPAAQILILSRRQLADRLKNGGIQLPDLVFSIGGAECDDLIRVCNPWYMKDKENEALDEYLYSLSNGSEPDAPQEKPEG